MSWLALLKHWNAKVEIKQITTLLYLKEICKKCTHSCTQGVVWNHIAFLYEVSWRVAQPHFDVIHPQKREWQWQGVLHHTMKLIEPIMWWTTGNLWRTRGCMPCLATSFVLSRSSERAEHWATWMHPPLHSVANVGKPCNKLPLARLMSVPHHHWLLIISSSPWGVWKHNAWWWIPFLWFHIPCLRGGNYTLMCTLPLRRNKQMCLKHPQKQFNTVQSYHMYIIIYSELFQFSCLIYFVTLVLKGNKIHSIYTITFFWQNKHYIYAISKSSCMSQSGQISLSTSIAFWSSISNEM